MYINQNYYYKFFVAALISQFLISEIFKYITVLLVFLYPILMKALQKLSRFSQVWKYEF